MLAFFAVALCEEMYSLVQFKDIDGGTLSIVNTEWLTPRKCEVYWPPVKGTKAFERLLTCSPNEKWPLYGVQRVFCETGKNIFVD